MSDSGRETKEKLVLERFKRKLKEHPELEQWYLLRSYVFARRYTEALALLEKFPDLINIRNFTGETVLHFLAVENDLEGVAWLHQQGFSLDTATNFGDPVIFEVAELGYKELLLWFKNRGADFDISNRRGQGLAEYLKCRHNEAMVVFINESIT